MKYVYFAYTVAYCCYLFFDLHYIDTIKCSVGVAALVVVVVVVVEL